MQNHTSWNSSSLQRQEGIISFFYFFLFYFFKSFHILVLHFFFFGICRSGAEFLGPLLPAVAEICSDFDPSSNVEPALLKLFRNLWFYIVLFGLAPPIQKNGSSHVPSKTVASSLPSVGSSGSLALQAVGGPYMFNKPWSQAVQQIAQGTPPLVRALC